MAFMTRKPSLQDGRCVTQSQQRYNRLQADAVRILEKVLYRSRWRPQDRDALALAIERVVVREIKAKPKGASE